MKIVFLFSVQETCVTLIKSPQACFYYQKRKKWTFAKENCKIAEQSNKKTQAFSTQKGNFFWSTLCRSKPKCVLAWGKVRKIVMTTSGKKNLSNKSRSILLTVQHDFPCSRIVMSNRQYPCNTKYLFKF